eukprot:3843383-Pyramimonas_sp.AAC.1
MASRRSKRAARRPQRPSRGLQEAKNIDVPRFLKVSGALAFSGQEGPNTAHEAPELVPRRPQRPPKGADN